MTTTPEPYVIVTTRELQQFDGNQYREVLNGHTFYAKDVAGATDEGGWFSVELKSGEAYAFSPAHTERVYFNNAREFARIVGNN